VKLQSNQPTRASPPYDFPLDRGQRHVCIHITDIRYSFVPADAPCEWRVTLLHEKGGGDACTLDIYRLRTQDN